jgi:hypothetical protein
VACNVATDCESGSCYQSLCCEPVTCEGIGRQCDAAPDGCGGQVDCGACADSLTCMDGQCQ